MNASFLRHLDAFNRARHDAIEAEDAGFHEMARRFQAAADLEWILFRSVMFDEETPAALPADGMKNAAEGIGGRS